MKFIPAGIAIVFLAVASTPLSAQNSDESAEQLAEQSGLGKSKDTEESASQLAAQEGDNPGTTDTEESAAQLATQDGDNSGTKDTEESAAQLAAQEGDNPGTKDAEESAEQLLNQQEGVKPNAGSGAPTASIYSEGDGVNGTVFATVAQPDGKVVIGGRFDSVGTVPRTNLARINADGTLDATFLPKSTDGVNGTVFALALDAQGNVLAGGLFSLAQDSPRFNFVRYSPAGVLDKTFNDGEGVNGKVLAIAVQPDGSIVIGGQFSQVGTEQRRNLAKFKPDGSIAAAIPGANDSTGTVLSLAVAADGSVIAGGTFRVTGQSGRNLLKAGN